tara:strand:- start:9569 stop:10162 length:594 start_codon:yes stop_codon:yes gene_type:complete
MSQLSNAINTVLCAHEDANLEISLLSFLMLDYHMSTEQHEYGHQALIKVYGFSKEQLDICYQELEYYGYIKLNYKFISFTSKGKTLFNRKKVRMSNEERVRLEKSFQEFWLLYPIKVGKKKAQFEWVKLRPNKSLVKKIIKAVPLQILWKKQEESKGKFVPQFQHAERWIKHERYNDECIVSKNFININNNTDRDER